MKYDLYFLSVKSLKYARAMEKENPCVNPRLSLSPHERFNGDSNDDLTSGNFGFSFELKIQNLLNFTPCPYKA